ncbi:MAG: ATP-binding protein [Marichromatium sp.]|nr:ATP-binding protein [Marichromatium sp.]
MIESETKSTRINYSTTNISEQVVLTILEKASYILNRKYTALNMHNAAGKEFIGVEASGLKYSALSMSAGEQKVFYILEKIYRADKNSLILIDEIDLLLHDGAMRRLIETVHERATDKSLQVVTTTHRETILDQYHLVNVRHIISKAGKSLCFSETKPDAINRLTGIQPRPIEIFVEDDLSAFIVRKLAGQLKGTRYVSVQRFGAAINCFTTVAGLLLGGEDCRHTLFVLDGDVYRTEDEKKERINKVLTGDDEQSVIYRGTAIQKISQYAIPEGIMPEQYLHGLIVSIELEGNEEFDEIIECAKEIVAANEGHKYIEEIITRLGLERREGLRKIIDLVAYSNQWSEYVHDVRDWMQQQIEGLIESPQTG